MEIDFAILLFILGNFCFTGEANFVTCIRETLDAYYGEKVRVYI